MTQTPHEIRAQTTFPSRIPIVAIVGRPNAGKSTLFNRLLRQRKAVIDNMPGVTRDRNFAQAVWQGQPMLLVDTGGLEFQDTDSLNSRVQDQTRLAISEADVIIFLFDGREGLNPADAEAVDLLRRTDKPTFFAVNKIDGDKQEAAAAEFFALGLDPLYTISAAHGRGVSDLMEAITDTWRRPEHEVQSTVRLPPPSGGNPPAPSIGGQSAIDSLPLHVAIVGRPNVGKSSLLNRLVGFERSIVDSTPGTTRDAVDSLIEWDGQQILLVDTAGARRKTKIHERIEQASVLIALKALERAEIGLLVIDAVEGITDQEVRLARYAWERGRALILVVNKWDAVPPEKKNQERYLENLHYLAPITTSLPVVFLSALTGSRLSKLLPVVMQVAKAHALQLPTTQLNRSFQAWTRRTPPPSFKGKQPKIFYVTQVGTKPPQLVLFSSVPEGITPAYERYLENQLRATFDLLGTPVKLSFRARRKDEEVGTNNDERTRKKKRKTKTE
jgi:GTP-binding protein